MKIQHPSAQTGFTLIELMITIALFSILLMLGSSLTRTWVDRSQVNSALTTFKTAVTQAKASALRNTNNQLISNSSVSVCLDSTTNTLNIIRTALSSTNVCELPSSPSAGSNTLLRTFPLSQDIFIKQGTYSFQCISFNSAGVLVLVSGSGCSSDLATAFKVGKNNETADIYIL